MQIVSDGQNLNNKLTKRPSVRQSRLFRERESGNTMKNLLAIPFKLGCYKNTGCMG